MLPPTTRPTEKISRNSSRADALLVAPDHVIGDAVVAAQHQGGDQPKHFLRLHAQRAGLVGPAVESEEAIDREVAGAQNQVVHPGAKGIEIREGIGHGGQYITQPSASGPGGSSTMVR